MTVAGWIITGLAFALVATLGIGATALNMERKRHEREENKIRQEGAANAQHTADIITEAEKIKNDANTGNHSDDLHTMADQLHNYAHGGK
jgi:hypothetical protein